MTLRFTPNLSMLFTEVPFLERFEAAASAGFEAVEFLFPYEAGVDNVAARARDVGQEIVLFDVPPGDLERGEIGFLGNPGRRDEFREGLDLALEAAIRLQCGRLNVLAGTRRSGVERAAQVALAIENLMWAIPKAADADVTLLLEALNPTDFPQYLLHSSAEAAELVQTVDDPHVRLQYDVYHAQMTQGNLINTITERIGEIDHIQISDVPGRHEPGTGEIRFPAVFACLEELAYKGHIGLEYQPSTDTLSSLAWMGQLKD
jgi:hydroxypyruvate isomerase